MDERWLKILQILYQAQRRVPVKEISKILKISTKTIKAIMKQHEHLYSQYDIEIDYLAHGGYVLSWKDSSSILRLLKEEQHNKSENNARIDYILNRLLSTDDFIKIEDLADDLFVSRITIDRLMPEIKAISEKYNLIFCSRARYGIQIQGTEFDKRMCYAHQIGDASLSDSQIITTHVQTILLTILQNHKLELNDINFYNLVQHCSIAIHRITKGNIISDTPDIQFDESVDLEEKVAKDIITQFEREFSINFPKAEEKYIIMHLLGKRVLGTYHVINEDILDCVNLILKLIKEQKHIDFTNDNELRTVLTLHIQPMISRLRYGMKQENTMLMEIKREMNLGFELAICAFRVIEKKYQLPLDEDETAYLALHFTVALERLHATTSEKKIVIVCSTGRGTAKLMQHRLVNRCHFNPNNLLITSAFQLHAIDFNNVLCILTTIPLYEEFPVPKVMIDMTLNQKSIEKIDQMVQKITHMDNLENILSEDLVFANKSLGSKEEVLAFLCYEIARNYEVDEDFYEQVLKRENLSSTEVGNCIALPHPQVYHGENIIISFLTLEKPIRWKFGDVTLVIFMALPPQETDRNNTVNDIIMQIVNDEDMLSSLKENLSLEHIYELLGGAST